MSALLAALGADAALALAALPVLRRPVGRVPRAAAAWTLALAAIAAAVALTARQGPWTRLLATVSAIVLFAKITTLARRTPDSLERMTPGRYLLYLTWLGPDPSPFLVDRRPPARPAPARLAGIAARLVLGAGLVAGGGWVAARHAWAGSAIAAVGMTLAVVFTAADAVQLALRRAGFAVGAVFDAPLASTSVADFWNRRWNLAFHQFAAEAVFRPAARALGAPGATWATFAVSAGVHEIAVSFPAGGGYGLPTAYFAIQAAAMLFERRCLPRIARGERPGAGRLWAILVVGILSPVLVHPPFLVAIVLPVGRALAGALG